jgi:hypothetical protein
MNARLAAIALTCSLGACGTFNDQQPMAGPIKDQHHIVDMCITGKNASDLVAFRSILDEINVKGLPVCSADIDADYVIDISRAVSDQGDYRIRFQLIDMVGGAKPRTVIDLSSTGRKIGAETEDQTIQRLIKHDRSLYLLKIGMVKW